MPGSSGQEGLRHSPAKGFAAALSLPPASSSYLPHGAPQGRVQLQTAPLGSTKPGLRKITSPHSTPTSAPGCPCQRPSPSTVSPCRSQVCDGGLQSVLWVLKESSKAATGLACSPQNHSVLVRLQHGARLHEGDTGPWALPLWGGSRGARKPKQCPRGNGQRGSASLGLIPGGWHRCSRCGTAPDHGSAIPAFAVVIWGESFDSRGMPLGFELPR